MPSFTTSDMQSSPDIELFLTVPICTIVFLYILSFGDLFLYYPTSNFCDRDSVKKCNFFLLVMAAPFIIEILPMQTVVYEQIMCILYVTNDEIIQSKVVLTFE